MVSWRTARIIFFCLVLIAGVIAMTVVTQLRFGGLLAVQNVFEGETSPLSSPALTPSPSPVAPITPLPRFPQLTIVLPVESTFAPRPEPAELDQNETDVITCLLCPS